MNKEFSLGPMGLQRWSTKPRVASGLEVALLALTFFCLPLFEAPKNVFSILFVLVWVAKAFQARSVGGRCSFNWLVFSLALILWIAPVFSAYGDLITPMNSAPRWTLLAVFVICAARLDYSSRSTAIILAALLIGGVFAVLESFWVWHLNGKPYPEFRSVGHVNHSSMYTLVTLAAGMGALYANKKWLQLLGLTAIASTIAFLLPSRSLVGGVAITAILAFGGGIFGARMWSLRGLIIASFGATALVACVILTPPALEFRSELITRVSGENLFSGRDRILNSALAVWDQHPVLGTGWFSFGTTTSEASVGAALQARGEQYDPDVYWHHAHGHNLWTTMLIERGLLGVSLVTILLISYFSVFSKILIRWKNVDALGHAVTVGAILTAVGFLVAGLGNTTMMNEHGQAGMGFISIAYGYLRSRGIVK